MILSLLLMLAQPEAGVSIPPFRGEVAERMETPVDYSFEAAGHIEDVELCIADAINVMGVPSVLRHGSNTLTIAAFSRVSEAIMASVTLTQATSDTVRAEIRVRGRSFNDRAASRARSCFNRAPPAAR